jgi:CHC2 zinc finger
VDVNIEELLQRLPKVKANGQNKWVACCPAHEDRSPSLAIKETDGTILLHCFSGCSPEDVCGAIGVEMHELFPPRRNEWVPGAEKVVKFGSVRFSAIDALRCLAGEGSIMLLLAADMTEGKVLGEDEQDRLATALGRIQAAMDYLGDNEIERMTII